MMPSEASTVGDHPNGDEIFETTPTHGFLNYMTLDEKMLDKYPPSHMGTMEVAFTKFVKRVLHFHSRLITQGRGMYLFMSLFVGIFFVGASVLFMFEKTLIVGCIIFSIAALADAMCSSFLLVTARRNEAYLTVVSEFFIAVGSLGYTAFSVTFMWKSLVTISAIGFIASSVSLVTGFSGMFIVSVDKIGLFSSILVLPIYLLYDVGSILFLIGSVQYLELETKFLGALNFIIGSVMFTFAAILKSSACLYCHYRVKRELRFKS